MPERPPLSVAALEMLAREEIRACHARYLDPPREERYATFRLGVDTVRCVLGCGGTTTNASSECDGCCRAHNDDELWHWGGARAVREQQITQDDGWANG